MNFCNFSKVILSRCSKDTSSLNWWTNKDSQENEQNIPSFSSNFTLKQRHNNYMMFMKDYPKMHIDFKMFEKRISRIQTYLTKTKYWTDGHTSSGKKEFLNNFSIFNWDKLPQSEKRKHQLINCEPCFTTHIIPSSAHKSVPKENLKLKDLCEEVAENIRPTTTTCNQNYGNKAIDRVLTTLKPLVENKYNINFNTAVCKSLKLTTPTSKKEQDASINRVINQTKKEIANEMITEDTENFLASGQSFAEHDRQRLATFFISTEDATVKVNARINHENRLKLKKKKHHGKFNKYSFNKVNFLQEIRSKESGAIVNWTALARKYDVNLNGKSPSNAGQILLEFAKSNGVNVFKFNKNTRVSGRDYQRRVRRSIKRAGRRKIRIPTPRTAKKINQDINQRIESGEINIGEKVVPKTYTKQVITADGKMESTTKDIFARKISLEDIRETVLDRFLRKGILRLFTDEDYAKLTETEVTERFLRIQEPCPDEFELALENLKELERTRHLKLWHDHSGILNHSHVNFMVSWIYDPANFLTDEEYKTLYPERIPVSIQTIVERPTLYIFGQSSSSDKDQQMYNQIRLEDIQALSQPLPIRQIPTYDIVRIFSGDGPARQFESGHQRGGKLSCICGIHTDDHWNIECCLRHKGFTSLDQRREIVLQGQTYLKEKDLKISPYVNMTKLQLDSELASRGIGTLGLSKPELQSRLKEILCGIQRPPALMTIDATKTAEEINCEKYEVMSFEPLHDITNNVVNIIKELPRHLKQIEKDLETFRDTTLKDKQQVKGSDARLFAIQLAQLMYQKYAEGVISKDVLTMVNALVEITSICYSREKQRSPKQVLRLHNQAFLFSVLAVDIIGNPSKLTSRKFYGTHFHTLTTHAPEAARLICLRSVLVENEERSFGDLRDISEKTTNRQAGKIIDNAMKRFPFQQERGKKQNSFRQQESVISKQAQLLPDRDRSIIPSSILEKRSSLVQAHFERIADFLIVGEGIWWTSNDDGDVIFVDGPNDPSFHESGPPLHHFRSCNLKEEKEYVKVCWSLCIDKFKDQTLTLPITRIRTYDENGKLHVIKKPACPVPSYADAGSNSETIITPDVQPEENLTDAASNFATDLQQEENMTDKNASHDETIHVTENETVLSDKTLKLQNYDNTTIADEGREKDNSNNMIKEKYKSFIKVMKWNEKSRPYQLRPSEIRKLPETEHKTRPRPIKRKLFQTDLTVESHHGTSTGITTNVIKDIVGSTPEYESYTKYRRMSKANPSDNSIRQNYERWQAKLQIQVSKRRSQLKEKANPTVRELQLTKQSEELLQKWGIYYC